MSIYFDDHFDSSFINVGICCIFAIYDIKWRAFGIQSVKSFYTFNLQIRNKLNQEQNSKLQQQKELLNKRNMEVTLMDKRISELRERLYKKKAEARQKENLPVRLRARSTPPL